MGENIEYLTLTEVAERMGVARMTARRYLDAGRFPNAVRKDSRRDGLWLIPLGDVLNSGIGRRYRHSPLPPQPDDAQPTESADEREALLATVQAQAHTIEQLTAVIAQLTRADHGA